LRDKLEICFPESDAELDLLTLPFKSTYRVLSFEGLANGVFLTPGFSIDDIRGKTMVIKSFKIIPYYANAAVDMYVTDGITVNQETIPINARIDRLFDRTTSGTFIVLQINGSPLNLFNAKFPLDLDLQNIYFKYPEKIQELSLQITGIIYGDINLSTLQTPKVVVNMEVYLI
jgi:hypothetical protein